jgi:hypothetical protein
MLRTKATPLKCYVTLINIFDCLTAKHMSHAFLKEHKKRKIKEQHGENFNVTLINITERDLIDAMQHSATGHSHNLGGFSHQLFIPEPSKWSGRERPNTRNCHQRREVDPISFADRKASISETFAETLNKRQYDKMRRRNPITGEWNICRNWPGLIWHAKTKSSPVP